MKRILFTNVSSVSFGLFILSNILAQNNDSIIQDTSEVIVEVKEYEVFASHGYDFIAGIQIINLSQDQLKYNGSITNLSDALQGIGGIYMRSYGNGMSNGITLRGFGPERTSTLWNGIALNNAGLGQLDMNLMPGGLFNTINLIEGSSSTQYGNGAQGGSLLLEYRPDFNNKFSMILQQEFGSFFTWNTFTQFNYGNKNFQGRSALIRCSSTNNYAYKDKSSVGFPTRDTENGNYFSYQAMQDFYMRFKNNWHFSLHGWYNYTDRKIPPPIGATSNNAQQFDKNLRVMAQLRKSFERHEIQLQLAYINDELIYHTDAIKDSSQIHSGQLQTQYIWKPVGIFTLMSGANFSINFSEYKYYNDPIKELRGNVFVLCKFELGNNLVNSKERYRKPYYTNLNLGVRQQFSGNYISYPSGHIGIEYKRRLAECHLLILSGAANSAYRMPTLNDLYWVPGGNTDLIPEYSWNLENSYKYQFTNTNTTLVLNILGYFGRTSNWIQWTPTSWGYWVPQNLTEVQSAGFEGGVELTIRKNNWNFYFNSQYNFTSTQDVNLNFNQLIYIPEQTMKGTIQVKWNEVFVDILPQFYSKRYTLSDESLSIPPFFLLNIKGGYTLKLKSCDIGVYCRFGNVTHTDYQMISNRPMPGLNFNAGINFNLHDITTK